MRNRVHQNRKKNGWRERDNGGGGRERQRVREMMMRMIKSMYNKAVAGKMEVNKLNCDKEGNSKP